MNHFDAIIIGTGQAAPPLAARFANAGKTVAITLWLALAWTGAALLFASLIGPPLTAAAIPAGLVGSAGLGALITVFGVSVGSAQKRVGLLSVLLCPIAVPVLLAGAQATTPGVAPLPWLALLVAYDLIVIAVGWAVFPVLLEE